MKKINYALLMTLNIDLL